MCDWMKRENKRITLSLFQPRELHGSYLIRMKALDVMTTMLQECFFPFSKVSGKYLFLGSSRYVDIILRICGPAKYC